MRTKIDLLIWKYVVPVLRQNSFRYRIIQLMAIGYVSCYSLPRRFLRHYFVGNGAPMEIGGAQMIRDNPQLLAIIRDRVQQQEQGRIHISQTALTDPKWKYSIGSCAVNYKRETGGLELTVEARYQYRSDSCRLTKYLHCRLAEHGKANDFPVNSQPFHIGFGDLEVPLAWAEMKTTAPFALYLLV